MKRTSLVVVHGSVDGLLASPQRGAFWGRFFLSACESMHYIPSPLMGEGKGGGDQGRQAMAARVSWLLPPSQPSPTRGEGAGNLLIDNLLPETYPRKPAGGGWRGEHGDGVLPTPRRRREHPPPGLPPLGGGYTPQDERGNRRVGVATRGEPFPEIA